MTGTYNNNEYESLCARNSNGNLNGAVEFGVDLAQPHTVASIQPSTASRCENVFTVSANSGPSSSPENVFTVSASSGPASSYPENVFTVPAQPYAASPMLENQGSIGAVSLPPGWNELAQPGVPPGTSVFAVNDGETFVPQNGDPSVKIDIGPGLQQVPQQSEAAFQKLLAEKPATHAPQNLTPQEFKSVAGVIMGFDGGNNQFHDMGNVIPKFDVMNASTININGKPAMLVRGEFLSGAYAGQIRDSIYIDNAQASGGAQGGIEQIYLTAPASQIKQYESSLWNTAFSIQWAPGSNGQYNEPNWFE